MAMEAAALVPVDPSCAAPPSDRDPQALALAQALEAADGWQAAIVTLALADLGDIRLPDPVVPPHNAAVLSALPALYWVHGLDQAGLLQAAETVAGLWASGAITVPLPDHGAALQQYWRTRHERLTAGERAHLLALVFDPRDFDSAMHRLCLAIVALADNAGQRDIREEVGLEQAGGSLLDLCATRLEGAPLLAAPDLLAQTRSAVQFLSQRALQTAFAVRDFYALIDLGRRAQGGLAGQARTLAERAQAGAAVLRWLVQAAARRFAIDPRAAAVPTLIADAQRWLTATAPAGPSYAQAQVPPTGPDDDARPRLRALRGGEPGHEHSGVGVAAA
jgi:hypothetical protein